MGKAIASLMIGGALMGWNGTALSLRLGLSLWQEAALVLFACGIVLMAQAPFWLLQERVKRLEARLTASATPAKA